MPHMHQIVCSHAILANLPCNQKRKKEKKKKK